MDCESRLVLCEGKWNIYRIHGKYYVFISNSENCIFENAKNFLVFIIPGLWKQLVEKILLKSGNNKNSNNNKN